MNEYVHKQGVYSCCPYRYGFCLLTWASYPIPTDTNGSRKWTCTVAACTKVHVRYRMELGVDPWFVEKFLLSEWRPSLPYHSSAGAQKYGETLTTPTTTQRLRSYCLSSPADRLENILSGGL